MTIKLNDAVDVARAAGIKIEQDPADWSVWIWIDGEQRAAQGFPMMEDAALNALENRYRLDWESQTERGETDRDFFEFCRWQHEDDAGVVVEFPDRPADRARRELRVGRAQASPPAQAPAPPGPGAQYVIYSAAAAEGSDDCAGFWNSDDGWTTLAGADVVPQAETERGQFLPIGGQWVEYAAAQQIEAEFLAANAPGP